MKTSPCAEPNAALGAGVGATKAVREQTPLTPRAKKARRKRLAALRETPRRPYLACRWLVLSDGAHPTEDIYFRELIPRLAQVGQRTVYLDTRARSPWRYWPLQAYAWRGANVVITRSLSASWLDWLTRFRGWFGEIYYLLDDDLLAAARDPSLPEEYRLRMQALVCEIQPRLFALADEVVVCSESLATTTRQHHRRVSVLPPSLISPLPDYSHHRGKRVEIGFHGTRAHLADLEALLPAIRAVHDARSESDFEIMLGANAPETLSRLDRVSCPDARMWADFLTYQRQRRLHIGLAPLLPTPFNRGKSWIKLLDIAVMGGVGLYSARAPYSQVITDGVDGLLVEDDAKAWEEALHRLIRYPDERESMARAAGQRAREVGDPAIAEVFWRQRGE
ncbi:glycosyltransferase [Salinicola sp. DM10]|uniref:glycosyltransferase family protein n=1 Tax=Salinicola sp. DM10 TaxID=2815721 RepID=UPI001A8E4F4E|nr:glycosyltransferase [Salinicola sp. DM10]MCE3026002.1 glycosyltransferase [Salinicola sp. DM10]